MLSFVCSLFEGDSLATDDSNVEVELNIGLNSSFSRKVKVGKDSKAIWYESIFCVYFLFLFLPLIIVDIAPVQLGLPADITQCPDLYV